MIPSCLLIWLFVFLRIDYVEFCQLCINYVVFSTNMFIDKYLCIINMFVRFEEVTFF